MKIKRTIQVLQAVARGEGSRVDPGKAKVALAELRGDTTPLPPSPRGLALMVRFRAMSLSGIPPTQKELGEALGISASTVCQHLNALEDRGCVERIAVGHRGNVKLTERGLDIVGGQA